MNKLWNLLKLLSVLIIIIGFTSSFIAIFAPNSATAQAAPDLPGPAIFSPPIAPNKPAIAPPQVNIALFNNPAYVDTNGTSGESDALQASLTQLGHTATTFSGITAADFTTALAGKDILIIPELEKGDLGTALNADIAARGVISNFVASGGGLIIHGSHDTSIDNPPKFLNEVFGFNIMSKGYLPANQNLGTFSFLDFFLANDTAFYDDVRNLGNFDATQFLFANSLPPGSKSIYATDFKDFTNVALMPYGSGQVVFIGWDWNSAAPLNIIDGGWLNILDSALHQLMPPDLEVQKRVSTNMAQAGEQIVYTVTFSNAGGAAGGAMLSNIVLTDIVPSQIKNVTYSSSGITITQSGGASYIWTVANMTPAKRGTILITGTLDSSLNTNTIFTNTATIAGTNDNNPGNNKSEAAILVTDIKIYLPLIAKETSGRN